MDRFGWKDARDVVLFCLGIGCLIWGVGFEVGSERIVLFAMAATLMGIPGGLFVQRNGSGK